MTYCFDSSSVSPFDKYLTSHLLSPFIRIYHSLFYHVRYCLYRLLRLRVSVASFVSFNVLPTTPFGHQLYP